MTTPANPARRVFLLGSVALVGTVACGPVETTDVDAGVLTVANFAVGRCVRIMYAPHLYYFVMRDSAGLYAMSANCTHELTPMPCPDPGAMIDCPLHHSKFDADGNNTAPPDDGDGAPGPLKHYQLTLAADGTLTVNTGVVVDRATRTAAT